MNIQRIGARTFVVVGGILWVAMAFGAEWAYIGSPLSKAMAYSALVALGIAAVFVVGLFYEYVAAGVLTAAVIAVVVYGAIVRWEAGLWATIAFFFLVPMIAAAVLYALAARMQTICELEE
jgi:hypothetical protein